MLHVDRATFSSSVVISMHYDGVTEKSTVFTSKPTIKRSDASKLLTKLEMRRLEANFACLLQGLVQAWKHLH